jgi:exodeoxyribonuclease VII large subunit
MTVTAIANACANRIARQNARLDAAASLLNALSPVATLRRGYSVTRVDGHAVTDASALAPGTTIETTLANGTITSTITSTQNNSK